MRKPTLPRLPTSDAATGDELTPSEALSHIAQGVIRRWTFIGVVSAVTLVCFTVGGSVLQWWNYSASWLALVIESVVGIGVYNMGRRDAVILREVRALSERGARSARRAEKATKRTEEAAKRTEDAARLALDAAQRTERAAEAVLDQTFRLER